MPLSPFDVGSETYSQSITMDASTVGNTTVTVAVQATRDQELSILDAIYDHGGDIGFKPFYNKANDFEYTVRREFTENLLEDCAEHVSAFSHQQRYGGNEDTQQVEAIHSALLVHDLLNELTDPPIVIVDGNQQQAQPFVDALSGLRDDQPTVGHCQQSELYYPTALLADLASNYLAHRFEDADTQAWAASASGSRSETDAGTSGEDLPIRAPLAKHTRGPDWGQAVRAIYQDTLEYTPPALPALRGESVQERIICWHRGAVASDSGADRPFSDSLRPVVNDLKKSDYGDLASILEEL